MRQRRCCKFARAATHVEHAKIGSLERIENHAMRGPEEQGLKQVPIVAPAPPVELLASVGCRVVHPSFLASPKWSGPTLPAGQTHVQCRLDRGASGQPWSAAANGT